MRDFYCANSAYYPAAIARFSFRIPHSAFGITLLVAWPDVGVKPKAVLLQRPHRSGALRRRARVNAGKS
jgi:hypothetical protein